MYKWQTFNKKPLTKKGVWKGNKKGTVYYYEPAFYDSETSKDTYFDDAGVEQVIETWVYIWACQVGNNVYYGRSITDFEKFLHILIDAYKLDKQNILVIYIHNLPFDISYFWYILFKLDPDLHILALSPNKPFMCQCHAVGLEFRCSYRLANRGLDKWAKDLNTGARKQVGMIDYKERHTPTDSLSFEQYYYLNLDVRTLRECFYKECEINNYYYYNVPLTSTGFVRRIFQKEYRQNINKNRRFFLNCQINADQYKRLLRAAAGGMSEAGRHIIGRRINGRIRHRDFDSHYPTQQAVNTYPMHPLTIYDREKKINEKRPVLKKKLEQYMKNKWLVLDVIIKDLHIKPGVTCPFMMISKVTKETKSTEILHVNGKIIQIKGCVRTCFTSDDYIIFKDQYDFTMNIIAADLYDLAPLPDYVQDTVKLYYQKKNELKELYKKEPTEENRLNMLLCKNCLNGIFGCMYTMPVRQDIQIDENFTYTVTQKDIETGLQEFFDNWNSCLCFQWGCRTTSAARLELYEGLKKIGFENFLYADTDSAFYIETDENKKALDNWNKELQNKSKENGYFVEYNGKTKYFNCFDDEHEDIVSFKALHSKCYGYILKDGSLHITVAGVSRYSDIEDEYGKKVTVTREEELGDLDLLQDKTKFIINGGTRATYKMHPLINYKGIETAGGCAILDTTKELHEVHCNEQPFIEWEVDEN